MVIKLILNGKCLRGGWVTLKAGEDGWINYVHMMIWNEKKEENGEKSEI